MPSTTCKIDRRYQGKPAPKIIDAVRFGSHYVDSSIIKEKAAGIFYVSIAAAAIVISCVFAMV